MNNYNKENIILCAGEEFFPRNLNFTQEFISYLNIQYRNELKKNTKLDFSFRFSISEDIFKDLAHKASLNEFNRGFGAMYPQYVDTRIEIKYNTFKESMVHFIEEETDGILYLNREKISKTMIKLFNTSFENPKEFIESFVKRKNNEVHMEILDQNIFHRLDRDTFPENEKLTLLNIPYLKNKNILDIRRKINMDIPLYRSVFQNIFKAIRDHMDIVTELSSFESNISSYSENMGIIIEEEKDPKKKYKLIREFRNELFKIRNIFLDKNQRNENKVRKNGEITLNNQFNKYIRYMDSYQMDLFDELIPENEIYRLREINIMFKQQIKIINDTVKKTIDILDDKMKRLDELSNWNKKLEKYTISEFARKDEIKQKRDLIEKDLNLIKDNWFERVKGHSNKMKTEEKYQNQLNMLDILLENEYNKVDTSKTDEEMTTLAEIEEKRELELIEESRIKEEITSTFEIILNGYIENKNYSVFDIKEEMNRETISKIIGNPRNEFEAEEIITKLKNKYRDSINEDAFNIETYLKHQYMNKFKEYEKSLFEEAKERRIQWKESIL